MPQQNQRFRGLVPVEGLGCAALALPLLGSIASELVPPPKLLHSSGTINSPSTGLQMVQCWSTALAQAVLVWRV